MLLPVETKFDEENNTLYAETDRLGTYCVMDMEILMQKLGISPDGISVENVTQQMYSAAPADAKNTTKLEKYYVTFIFDIRKEIGSDRQLDNFIEYVIGFANEAFGEGRDITIRLMTQDVTNFFNDSYTIIGECTNIDEFNKSINSIKLSKKEGVFGDYCSVTDALTYVVENSSSNVKNYVFDIYDQTNALFDNSAANSLMTLLETNTNHINISMISNFHEGVTGFQREITRKTSGININSSKDFGDIIYDHVFNDFPDLMNAILISGYEDIELKDILNKYNGIDTDYEECAEGEDDIHKNDHLTDWEEVGVDHWVNEGLMSYDDDGNAVLPTIKECMDFTELSYIEKGLERYKQTLGIKFDVAIYSVRVLPILSDPTKSDSDGDGIVDKYDPHPLQAIDKETNCLYYGEIDGVENHVMILDSPTNYVCVQPNCGYSVMTPEYEDYENLGKTDYVMVRILLSLYNKFCDIREWNMADVVYLLIDKIRKEYILEQHHYSYSDEQGNYVSPCEKWLSNDETYDFLVEATITDYTGSAELKDIVEYIKSISIYVWKDIGDVVALFLPKPISLAWTFYSEGMINIFEHLDNYWYTDNLASFMINDIKSSFFTCLDSAIGPPIASAVLTTQSILSHVGIYITNAHEMLNFDDGLTNDFKAKVSFKIDGIDDSIDYFYNLKDILVGEDLNISSELLCTSSQTQTLYKNAFVYSHDGKYDWPLAIVGKYYYRKDISEDGFPWRSYYEKSNIPLTS